MIFIISSTKIALWEMASSKTPRMTFVIILKKAGGCFRIKDKLV